MDATTALGQTNDAMTKLIAGLTPDHREMATPCTEWTVHDVLAHVCEGAHMIAGGMQGQAPPEETPDFLAEGPANGWANAHAALVEAATPERLAATHQMPFGEVPGEMAIAVITADHLTHGWDVAKATGLELDASDELAEWALATWQGVLGDGPRQGGFDDVVDISPDAPAIERLAAFTGRNP